MNRMRWVVWILGIVVGLAMTGCGGKTKQASPQTKLPPGVVLPEWAPKNPSPEFLRAARVLKPMPPEVLRAFFSEKAAPQAKAAMLAKYSSTWTSAYELFGSLSDEQIERFRATKEVRVPVKSMTGSQRRALDSYFEAWRSSMAGDEYVPDLLVYLYKDGAQENLSNVDAGFVGSGPSVNLQFWITRPDGSVSTPSNTVAFM